MDFPKFIHDITNTINMEYPKFVRLFPEVRKDTILSGTDFRRLWMDMCTSMMAHARLSMMK